MFVFKNTDVTENTDWMMQIIFLTFKLQFPVVPRCSTENHITSNVQRQNKKHFLTLNAGEQCNDQSFNLIAFYLKEF